MADDSGSGENTDGDGSDGSQTPSQQPNGSQGGQNGSQTGQGGSQAGQNGGEGDESLEQLRERLAAVERDRDSWKQRSRQHEDRAKQNADAAKAKGTLEEQIDALRKDIATRDAEAVTERAEQASDKLHARLVRGGLSDDDAATLVGSIDPMRLLVEGKPDTGEIDKLAKSLVKVGTRPAPDGDQGRKGGDQPPSMNQLIRGFAQRNQVSS